MIKKFISKELQPQYLTPEDTKFNKKALRWLGSFAIVLGFLVVVIGKYLYGLDFHFTSISASANFYGTAYILPFVLGGMAIFFWCYTGYAKIDRHITKTMSIAAFFVAMFQCNEFGTYQYQTPQKISLLGLPPELSNIIHTVAAIALFISLIIWIVLLFSATKDKSGKVVYKWWKEWSSLRRDKKISNIIYCIMGFIAIIGAVLAVLGFCKVTGVPFIWLGEVIILIASGIALLVKSDWWLFAENKIK
jgi:hypothetical protein